MDIFSKIAAGEIPSYKCAENEEFYAFLDINPLVKGHTLVIPRREVDYFFDMDDDELARYQAFAKRVAKAIKAAFPCKNISTSSHSRQSRMQISVVRNSNSRQRNSRKSPRKSLQSFRSNILARINTAFVKDTASSALRKPCP